MKLLVTEALSQDVYKDTVRIHKDHRNQLPSGRLAKISITGGTGTIAAVRGIDDGKRNQILLDLETRRRLRVKLGQTYDFTVSRIWPWQKLQWALNASDPAARIATWIAVCSFVLGSAFGIAGILISFA